MKGEIFKKTHTQKKPQVVPGKFSDELKKQVPHICHKVALATENSLVKLQTGREELKEVLE